jgi:D-alanine-D-alanine ligase
MKVAVIQGGPSAEAEVSRRSAQGVASALTQAGHDVIRVELGASLAAELQCGVDVVFPTTHGRFGEDGCLQGMLEVIGLPYVGSGVLGSALAFDKIAAKTMFRAAGLPVADDGVLHAGCNIDQAVKELRVKLGRAVVVKPAAQGSAIGVTRVSEDQDDSVMRAALQTAFELGDQVLCERFVAGREITCGILDVPQAGGLVAFPPTEIFSKAAGWYDFASRYAQGGSVHQCPADLDPVVAERVQQCARIAHASLGCRDMSRVDFVVSDAQPSTVLTVLEVNTLPGMTSTSLYPEAAEVAGYRFDRLCDLLVRAAVDRAAAQRTLKAVPIP